MLSLTIFLFFNGVNVFLIVNWTWEETEDCGGTNLSNVYAGKSRGKPMEL